MNPSYFLPTTTFPPGPSNYTDSSSSTSPTPDHDVRLPPSHLGSSHPHPHTTAQGQGQGQIQTGPMIHPHQDLHSFLESFWTRQMDTVEIENPDWKSYNLPLARIKKVMKSDEDVKMISAEAPIMFSKACEIFISELTCRAWLVAESHKRRTLQKSDVAAAIAFSDMFDFLIDIVPRDDGTTTTSTPAAGGGGGGGTTATATATAGVATGVTYENGGGVGSGATSVGIAEEEEEEEDEGDVDGRQGGYTGVEGEEGDDLYNEYVQED